MLINLQSKSSARRAKEAGFTDTLFYLCRERVAAALELMRSVTPANGVSLSLITGCFSFATVIRALYARWQALIAEWSFCLSGFQKLTAVHVLTHN
jgi:hypothetical protein